MAIRKQWRKPVELIDHQAHWYPPAYLETLSDAEHLRVTQDDDGTYRVDPGSGSRSFEEILRAQFMVDTAMHSPGAVAMAAQTYGGDRVLYATDYPWWPRDMTDEYLAAFSRCERRGPI